MAKQSPLHDLTAKAGAVFAEYNGWLMPAHYGDPIAEYHATREGSVVIDLSHRTKIELRGKDRVSFLQNLCTNDVAKLQSGEWCEAFLTTAQAKIVARVIVYSRQEGLWLDAEAGLAQSIVAHFERYHITEDVAIEDRTEESALLHLTNLHPSEPTSSEAIRLANSRLAIPGFDFFCPAAEMSERWQGQVRRGVKPAGLIAYDILRIEAGIPEYGKDIDDTNLPQEVGRDDKAISFTKGCYIGQETVARIRSYGHVNRLLVGLKLDANEPVAAGAKLLRDGQEVGKITSSVVSPRIGSAIALGYVRRGHNDPGTSVAVESGVRAIVTGLPFA